MNVEELKRVVKDQKDLLEEKLTRNYVSRETPDLLKYLTIPNVLAILGVRRSGKSTLSILLLRGKKFSYVNFDDESLQGVKSSELRNLEQAIYEIYGEVDYMVFDEIQNVEGWELFISRLRESKRVIITGSNSRLLSGELATALTGRHSDYTLFPFSFKEYLEFKGIKVAKEDLYSTRVLAMIKNELEKYLESGGFPEALILGKEQINVIYNDILFKDVVTRYKIKEIEKFREFARTLVSYYSSEISFNKLSKVLDVDTKTLNYWFSGLEEAYLTFLLPRYGEKLRERLTYNKKLYVVDTGIINRVAVRYKDKGRLMENLVAIKLFRDRQSLDRLYYIRNNFEVDFYDENALKLIQVTYATDKIEEREIKGLVRASEVVKAKELLIISWDIEEEIEVEGKRIKVIPLYKFLLS